MNAPHFIAGRNFTLRGHCMRVAEVNHGTAICYTARGGSPSSLTITALEEALAAGHVTLEPLPSASESKEQPTDYDCLPDDSKVIVDRRLAYVNAFLEEHSQHVVGLPRAKAETVISETAQKRNESAPAYVSVTRWVRQYRESGHDRLSLVPRLAQCGNRNPRLPEEAQSAIAKAVAYWLSEKRPTVDDAHRMLTTEIMELNSTRPASAMLAIPSYETLAYAIRNTDIYVTTLGRWGANGARRLLRTRAAGPIATLLLERVEIDHSPIDLLCVNEDGRLIGRPILTLAIDKATRCPVGVHISYIPPSTVTVLECIKNSVTPKDYIRERFPQIKDTWPCHGLALQYVVDNGKEFHSKTFQALKSTLGANISYMPGRHPWFKGVVERFFQSHNKALTHNLPGTTKSNAVARGDYPAERNACLTMAEFESLFMKWLIDVYLNTVHTALGTTPRLAWEKLAAVNPPRTLDPDINLDVAVALIFERRINNGRIRFAGLDYWSPELVLLEVRLGAQRTISFKVNPSDLSAIHVMHPDTQTYFSASCTDAAYAKGLSLHLHMALRAMDRETAHRSPTTQELAQRKSELKRQTEETLNKAKRRTRRRAKRIEDDLAAHEAAAGRIATKRAKHPDPLKDVTPPSRRDDGDEYDDANWVVTRD